MAEMIQLVQFKRGTKANLEAVLIGANVPKAGEPVWETDTNKIKIGDGTTAYKDLPYLAGGSSEGTAVYQGDIALGEDKLAKIAEITAGHTINSGDIAIIRELIDAGKYQYTAFVYTGSAWAAMDGNYDAENVYFASDITYTKAIGELPEVPSTGSATLAAKGKNVKQVLDAILSKEVNPTPVLPRLVIESSNIGEKEVGENIAVIYTTAFDAGKYSFGPATGIIASNYAIKFNNQTLTVTTGTFDAVQVTEDTNLKITGTFDHTQGAMPVTNLGNEYPGARIPARTGRAAVEKGALTGYRKMFYGTKTDKTELTSAKVRLLTGEKAEAKSIIVPVAIGAMRTVIAVPADKTVTSVKDMNASGAEIFSAFTTTTLLVEGANNYTAINYNLYALDYAEAIGTANAYKVTIE